ncbi:DUF4175 domain-containing protein [Celeribacter litoreus]|uniref:DUF4175 domain-containing protein n=1 Tax=Celeribacter litoreus TaxID=2876714 RepID=UPI001CCE3DAB|nr:DUF4175 family protein [Celeribacter litoreus]MCA0044338.1 DUF4175 domain-containing protein [Celeribacter litoreus]
MGFDKNLYDRLDEKLARRVRRSLGLTWLGFVFERAAFAFWPLFSLICVAGGLSLLGVQDHLPLLGLRLALGVFALLFLIALWTGFRRLHLPTRPEVTRRVDEILPGRPLQALSDQPLAGAGDPASERIWDAHRTQMIARLAGISFVAPFARLSDRDPYALRLISLTVLGMGLVFGSLDRTQSLADIGGRADELASGPIWEGWIRPPTYSEKPTLYLGDLERDFDVPKGSDVTLRFYGEDGVLELKETVSGDDVAAMDFAVQQAGEIEIDGPTGRLWQVALQPDRAPVAELVEGMTRAPSGEARQSFRVTDDFGVTRAVLTIKRDPAAMERRYGYVIDPEDRPAIEIPVSLPQTGDRTELEGRIAENLALHPFAGLPVSLSLSAWDAAGQESVPSVAQAILPTRRFFDPLAAAIVDQRRELLWNRENATRTAQVLRAVSVDPAQVFGDMQTYRRLRGVIGEIEGREGALTDTQVEEISAELWDIALELEDGELKEALARLQRAQERLSQAMRDGATPEEIQELMQELREATRDYIQQLAEQNGPQDDGTDTPDQQNQEITGDQIQQLMDRIQELMEEGRMAEAQQLMDMLAQLLENLRVTQNPGQGQGGEGMQGLQDMLRDQQQLNDDTFSDLQDQFDQGQEQQGQSEGLGEQGEGQQQQGQGETGYAQSLSERQEALRNLLGQRRNEIPGGNEDGDEEGVGGALERADRAMDDAADALEEGDLSGALDSQAEAMEALREGMRRLGQRQQAQNEQNGEQDGTTGGQQSSDGNQRDPLGRNSGDSAQYGSDDPLYGGNDATRRAEELLDEIERRAEDQTRDREERDYLNRLLDQF